MQIIKNSRLTGRQISDIDHLIQECRAFSPIRLSFPFEEGSVFYLAYERKDGADMLVSVLALIIPNMTILMKLSNVWPLPVRLAGGKVTFLRFLRPLRSCLKMPIS